MRARISASLLARAALVLLISGVVGYQAVRTAFVRGGLHASAARLWPSHPEVELRQTMVEIGTRAARGQALTAETLERVDAIARKSPLAAEPFLIKAAVAQLARHDGLAERLLVAARARDPRSRATRYLLAERYLRTGRTVQALMEISVLSRLIGGASGQFVPALALFARSRGAAPQLKQFFRTSPEFEAPVLYELAGDPNDTDLILALWSGSTETPIQAPDWKGRLIARLVEQGEFARAYSVWSRLSGVAQRRGGIFNTTFSKLSVPAPFNWTFSSSGGVVEPTDGGRLQVIYFGRQDAVLAEQLLLLAPGRYRLSMEITGGSAEQSSVSWTIRCVPGRQVLSELSLGRERAKRQLEVDFSVPAGGCPAQRLQLTGTPGEFSGSAEFQVGKLQLSNRLPT